MLQTKWLIDWITHHGGEVTSSDDGIYAHKRGDPSSFIQILDKETVSFDTAMKCISVIGLDENKFMIDVTNMGLN